MKVKIKFTGSFGEYFFTSIVLLILSIITLGIMLPYYAYWSIKYFVDRLEFELPEPASK